MKMTRRHGRGWLGGAGCACLLLRLSIPSACAGDGDPAAGLPSAAAHARIVSPDEALDALSHALGISAFNGQVRAQVSGLLDLEGYAFSSPAPALIESNHSPLPNPRLSLFIDANIGPNVYAFLQARLDRGFDPADQRLQARLDEYFVRANLVNSQPFSLAAQAGKFATVVGNWTPRHLSWDNPFIDAPLPYENVTSVADGEVPSSRADFHSARSSPIEKYDRLPVIWGANYASGLALAGQIDRHVDYAFEIKNAALSSRPATWDGTARDWSHPTFSGRLGGRPSADWNLGVSASGGAFLTDAAVDELPAGGSLGDYRQYTLGQDLAYAHRHLQLWAEAYESRFQVPAIGNADTFAYYVEGKYQFTPEFWTGLRWNQQIFGDVPDGHGGEDVWGNDLWRTDLVAGYRASDHFQLKLQYSVGRENDPGRRQSTQLGALQLTTKF